MIHKTVFSPILDLGHDDVPMFIPTFNQPTLLEMTLSQFKDYGMNNPVVVYDNASSYPPMVDLLHDISADYSVVLSGRNSGPRIFTEDEQILALMPDHFIVTDPDLIYNKSLPDNFIDEMRDELENRELAKIGMALEVHDVDEQNKFQDVDSVLRWENPYWMTNIGSTESGNKIFDAYIDTTFSLNSRDRCMRSRSKGLPTYRYSSARIGDNYTCRHVGWWKKELMPQTAEELEFYLQNQRWSHTEIHYYR